MFGKKKEPRRPPRKPKTADSLEQYGIFEEPGSLDNLGQRFNQSDDDGDLEAELNALTFENDVASKLHRKVPAKRAVNLDSFISENVKNISMEDDSADDYDLELLDELNMLTADNRVLSEIPVIDENPNTDETGTMNLLKDRLLMYRTAVSSAKSKNDHMKERRFSRGVKAIENLINSARCNVPISSEDIPPVLPPSATAVFVAEPASGENISSSSQSQYEAPLIDLTEDSVVQQDKVTAVSGDKLNYLKNRQREYKIAALAWKKCGNSEEAIKLMREAKQMDILICSVLQGEIMDSPNIPPVPQFPLIISSDRTLSVSGQEMDTEQNANTQHSAMNTDFIAHTNRPMDVLLNERLEIYRRSKKVSETEGNMSKARRYARICKQFEDALKLHACGRSIPLDELPNPPGFLPLGTPPKKETVEEICPSPLTSFCKDELAGPSILEKDSTLHSSGLESSQYRNSVKKLTSRADKQLQHLQQRQRELKVAALNAKKEGALDSAKDYLRQAKGIDPLITASLSGLPVDMTSIPLSPGVKVQLEEQCNTQTKCPENISNDGFTIIAPVGCEEEASGSNEQIYDNLEAQLVKQVKYCMTTRDHCKALGDVASYNKWSRLALDYTKDLDMLRVQKRNNFPPPKHHYEIKTFSIVKCCTDLTDADLEITIVRGINFAKETDTYVVYEFPYPLNSHTTDRTATFRDTNNPEYNTSFCLTGLLDRKNRQCLRVFKRHGLKCHVWAKGGFFRSDILLGVVIVKLQHLETHCILHDSFPLMEGRKETGGKLEVQIRVRNPIFIPQEIDHSTDKWLVVDH